MFFKNQAFFKCFFNVVAGAFQQKLSYLISLFIVCGLKFITELTKERRNSSLTQPFIHGFSCTGSGINISY